MTKKSSAAAFTAVLICLILSFSSYSASSPSPIFDTCHCDAPDGSCSATVTCQGRCEKYCGNNDNCWAECSGFFGVLAAETSLEMSGGTYSQLVSKLARISGRDISFTKGRLDIQEPEIGELGFKRAPLWSALEFLSDRGTVRIGGKDFEALRRLRKSLLSGERINFGVKNTPVQTFVTDLVGLTGLPFHITRGEPLALANVELQEVNLDEIVAKVSEQTGTKIVCDNNDSGTP